jgi:hypothetical protein
LEICGGIGGAAGSSVPVLCCVTVEGSGSVRTEVFTCDAGLPPLEQPSAQVAIATAMNFLVGINRYPP